MVSAEFQISTPPPILCVTLEGILAFTVSGFPHLEDPNNSPDLIRLLEQFKEKPQQGVFCMVSAPRAPGILWSFATAVRAINAIGLVKRNEPLPGRRASWFRAQAVVCDQLSFNPNSATNQLYNRACCSTTLGLNFSLCKMGKIIHQPHSIVDEIK